MAIDAVIAKYGLPPGYVRLPWRQATVGQQVYVYGTEYSVRVQYPVGLAVGPYVVLDASLRMLRNPWAGLCGFSVSEEALLVESVPLMIT